MPKSLIESLIAEGVETIFGYPGGAILPTYDALLDSKIKHVLVRHEQGATHMAEGYARVSGRPGVVIVTSGPGATNAVTGIADAYMDSTPMVVISGQVPTTLIGNDAFQEADFVGITRPCTKHNYLVKDVRDVARIVKEAFYIASTGRPGPVIVDVPRMSSRPSTPFTIPTTSICAASSPPFEAIRAKSNAPSRPSNTARSRCSMSAAASNGRARLPN